eukprot:m.74709 g.74709  ORF g.74709 m.74709 type:complete len:274 (+) comp12475_c0_seq2:285-1106(+)
MLGIFLPTAISVGDPKYVEKLPQKSRQTPFIDASSFSYKCCKEVEKQRETEQCTFKVCSYEFIFNINYNVFECITSIALIPLFKREVEEGEGIDLEAYHTEMQKHVEKFEKQIVNIKIGPVSPSILDDIKIEMGGELIPLASAAQVQAKDANTLVITTFHSDDATAVQKALLASSIGITPSKEDKVLKLGFPKASAEYRQELTRKVKELADKTQVRLRRERSNAIKEVKALKSVGGYGKDDIKRLEKEVASWAEAASKNVTKELDKKISELKK